MYAVMNNEIPSGVKWLEIQFPLDAGLLSATEPPENIDFERMPLSAVERFEMEAESYTVRFSSN